MKSSDYVHVPVVMLVILVTVMAVVVVVVVVVEAVLTGPANLPEERARMVMSVCRRFSF